MISDKIAGDWLEQMKRVRRHFTIAQFKIFLDELEKIIGVDYGKEEVEIRDRQIDTFTTTIRKKVRNI